MIVKSKLQRVIEREVRIAHDHKKSGARSFAEMIEEAVIDAYNEARGNGEDFVEITFELSDKDRRELDYK
tara:strand:- start:1751 stop:1960 length:210 start_codon:yes stop_codon:yes gene_type:complete